MELLPKELAVTFCNTLCLVSDNFQKVFSVVFKYFYHQTTIEPLKGQSMRTTSFSSTQYKFLTALALVAMVLAALPAMPAYAASITVQTTTDEVTTNGACSLREAILNANNNGSAAHPDCIGGSGEDTIILTSGSVYTLSLVGAGTSAGDLDIA